MIGEVYKKLTIIQRVMAILLIKINSIFKLFIFKKELVLMRNIKDYGFKS